MKSLSPAPLEPIEIRKLAAVLPLTKTAKIAMKTGTTPEVFLDSLSESGATRQALHAALRHAGHRTRKVRSDRGRTLKVKIDKLLEEAKALEAKLSGQQQSSASN